MRYKKGPLRVHVKSASGHKGTSLDTSVSVGLDDASLNYAKVSTIELWVFQGCINTFIRHNEKCCY